MTISHMQNIPHTQSTNYNIFYLAQISPSFRDADCLGVKDKQNIFIFASLYNEKH